MRIKCTTTYGESAWGEEVLAKTPLSEDPDLAVVKVMPLSWLYGAAACTDIAINESKEAGGGHAEFIRGIAGVLNPNVMSLRRAYGHYATAVQLSPVKQLSQMRFLHMLRDIGLTHGCLPATAKQAAATVMLGVNECDLMFTRLVSAPAGRRSGIASVAIAAAQAAAASPTSDAGAATPNPPTYLQPSYLLTILLRT